VSVAIQPFPSHSGSILAKLTGQTLTPNNSFHTSETKTTSPAPVTKSETTPRKGKGKAPAEDEDMEEEEEEEDDDDEEEEEDGEEEDEEEVSQLESRVYRVGRTVRRLMCACNTCRTMI
jgi:hypothetical protein